MLNFFVSLARTGVPYVWGVLVSWLAARGLPDEVLASVNDPALSGTLVAGGVAVITTAVYALVRVIEVSLPKLLGAVGLPAEVVKSVSSFVLVLLIGVPTQPKYHRPPVDELPVDEDQADGGEAPDQRI